MPTSGCAMITQKSYDVPRTHDICRHSRCEAVSHFCSFVQPQLFCQTLLLSLVYRLITQRIERHTAPFLLLLALWKRDDLCIRCLPNTVVVCNSSWSQLYVKISLHSTQNVTHKSTACTIYSLAVSSACLLQILSHNMHSPPCSAQQQLSLVPWLVC